MATGIINRILPFSSVDGPGNRTVIFLQGCNLDCRYCHNPETINRCSGCGICVPACPAGALQAAPLRWDPEICTGCDRCLQLCCCNSSPKTVQLTAEQLLTRISQWSSFTSGITVSGGEATLQAEFLTEFFSLYKKEFPGKTRLLDTNGIIPLQQLPRLLNLTDGVMLDVKSCDPDEHRWLTGQDGAAVLPNLEYAAKTGKLSEVRTVIVPDWLNNRRTVECVSRIMGRCAPEIPYKLIRFRPHGVRSELLEARRPDDQSMEALAATARAAGCSVLTV